MRNHSIHGDYVVDSNDLWSGRSFERNLDSRETSFSVADISTRDTISPLILQATSAET